MGKWPFLPVFWGDYREPWCLSSGWGGIKHLCGDLLEYFIKCFEVTSRMKILFDPEWRDGRLRPGDLLALGVEFKRWSCGFVY